VSITAYSQVRFGNITRVTATSDLSGTIYYHWYLDGAFVGSTQDTSWDFILEDGEQAHVEALDTNNADFDPITNAPDGYSARRTIWWVRSISTVARTEDVDHYRVEQQQDGGEWTEIAVIPRDGDVWTYSVLTGRLTDLSTYAWRVTPVGENYEDGVTLTLASEIVVRTPDAPDFTITFDPDTDKITVAAA